MKESLNCMKMEEAKKRLHKDAFRELTEHMVDGECPVAIIEGNSAQAIIATNRRRVFVFKKGMMAGMAFGRRMYSWDFDKISGVRLDVRIVNGYVALETFDTDDEEISYWGVNGVDAWTAANAIPISKLEQEQARDGAAKLRKMLHAFHTGKTPHTTPVQQQTILEPTPQLIPHNQAARMQFCFACGSKLQPNSVFCSACGQRLIT